MAEWHDTIIAGGGQAALALSYHLRRQGRDHVIFERGRIAERWHSERWDSLRFQFPNWMIELPGRYYSGADPDGFADYREIAKFISDYASWIEAPVREGLEVASVSVGGARGGFLVRAGHEEFEARQVVLATGPFQRPKIPPFEAALPKHMFQVHASRYTNPDALPEGAVLVVGSGASGFQIAEDLCSAGREVYLSISRHRRVPRRYRGHDMGWWFSKMGRFDVPIDQFPGRRYPPSTVVTGVAGGYDANVRQLAAKGVVILGRLLAVRDGRAAFGGDAEQVLAEADNAFAEFCNLADGLASSTGMRLPAGGAAQLPVTKVEPVPELDFSKAGIRSVIWCTGYAHNFEWLKVPVLDEQGAPVQRRGVTSCPGLYFLGLHWMHTFKSGLLFGAGEDARHLAELM